MYLQKLFNFQRWRTIMKGILHSLNGSNIFTVGCKSRFEWENYANEFLGPLLRDWSILRIFGLKFSVQAWCIKVLEDSLRRAYGVNRNKSHFIIKICPKFETFRPHYAAGIWRRRFHSASNVFRPHCAGGKSLNIQQYAVILDLWLNKTQTGKYHIVIEMSSPSKRRLRF